jgi:sec-independent protein translocase protein TatA
MVGDILQPTHLLFILVVALLVLGPKRLPEVGRTLGTGLRDFKAAINGETHDDPAPRAYVEAEPDPVPPYTPDGSEIEPVGFDLSDEHLAEPDVPEEEPATPTALHEQQLDPHALGDDLHAPAVEDLDPPPAVEDLHPQVATNGLLASDDLHAPVATDESTEPATVAVASSGGFASALASSRQRPAGDGEPTVDDE